MIRPKVFNILAGILAVLFLAAGNALAQGTLKQIEADPLPASVREGTAQSFRLQFRKASGARIKTAVLSLDSPSGTGAKINGTAVTQDTAAGSDIKWNAKLNEPGTYKATFIVTDGDGDTTTYPTKDEEAYKFTVENLWIKVAIFAVTVLVGLLFLPFLVYTIFRSMNQRGDPSGAARGGLMIGILICGAVFIWDFASFLGPLAFGIGILIALVGIVMVLTQKRR